MINTIYGILFYSFHSLLLLLNSKKKMTVHDRKPFAVMGQVFILYIVIAILM